jgi:hypothetical protein
MLANGREIPSRQLAAKTNLCALAAPSKAMDLRASSPADERSVLNFITFH